MSRPRAATRRNASCHEKTPASVAATYSPTLWPSIAAGSKSPLVEHACERELDDEERRLCERGLRERLARASGAAERRSGRRSSTPSATSRSHASSTCRRNVGSDRGRARPPCPGCCAPWPGKRNTTGRSSAAGFASDNGATARRRSDRLRRRRARSSHGGGRTPAPDLERVRDVGEVEVAAALELVGQAGRRAGERRRGPCRQHHDLGALPAAPRALRHGRLFQHEVRVRAADAERAHACAPRRAVGLPRRERVSFT